MNTNQTTAITSLYDVWDAVATNSIDKGTKTPKKSKKSETKSLSYMTIQKLRKTEYQRAQELFLENPLAKFTRVDLVEKLELPLNNICKVVYDLLDSNFIEPAGNQLNPKSGRAVEALRLNTKFIRL